MTTQAPTNEFVRYGDKEMAMNGMSLDDAKTVMAQHFPELANPKVETIKEAGKTIHVFSKQAGTKGAGTKGADAVTDRLMAIEPFMPVSAEIVALSRKLLTEVAAVPTDIDTAALDRAWSDASSEAGLAHRMAESLLVVPPNWEPEASTLSVALI